MHNAHVYMYYYSKNDHLDLVVIKAANVCQWIELITEHMYANMSHYYKKYFKLLHVM